MEEVHTQNQCPKEMYGIYSNDIEEGREADQEYTTASTGITCGTNDVTNDAIVVNDVTLCGKNDVCSVQDNSVIENKGNNEKSNVEVTNIEDNAACVHDTILLPVPRNSVQVIIGDSNGTRIHKGGDKSVKNLSLSGRKFTDVRYVVRMTSFKESVESVVVHLGTNDMKSQNKQTVVENARSAFQHIHKKWPEAEVAFSSILPRLGGKAPITKFNNDAKFINNLILKLCEQNGKLHYIDNDDVFVKDGNVIKSLFDSKDPSGVHVSDEGAVKLYENWSAFLLDGVFDEEYMVTPTRKRPRSSNSSTPSSDTRALKHGKCKT